MRAFIMENERVVFLLHLKCQENKHSPFFQDKCHDSELQA